MYDAIGRTESLPWAHQTFSSALMNLCVILPWFLAVSTLLVLARVFSHNDVLELSEHTTVPVINALSDLHQPLHTWQI